MMTLELLSERLGATLTEDFIAQSDITIVQRKDGYRFGSDALLLANDLPPIQPSDTIVELGAAHGPVALSIARQFPQSTVIAVERQPLLFDLLQYNIARNDLQNVRAICADLRHYRQALTGHCADLVVCNPPYFARGQRRPSTIQERAEAHHELHGTLQDFLNAARYILRPRGWCKLIIPPLRIFDLYEAIKDTDLNLLSMRFIYSGTNKNAYLAEIVARRGGTPDLKILPPIML